MKHFPMEDPKPGKRLYLPELSDTVSFMECTGLMPSLPRSEEEFASYQALSSMAIPQVDEGNGPEETPRKK